MRKRAVLAASLALAPASVANAHGTNARTRAAQQQAALTAQAQQDANREKARNTYVVPGAPVLHYTTGPVPGSTETDAFGVAGYDPATQTVYSPKPLDAFMKAHESGHAVDDQTLSEGDRIYFQKLMHAPAGAWYQGTGMPDGYHSPSEWFADYYAAAATHMDLDHGGVSSYAKLGPKRLKRFEKALQRLAKRHNLQPYKP